MILDHSGNIVRFAEDFEGIFHNGLDALDMGEKLDKAIRKEPEEDAKKGCPSCGFKPFKQRCMSCGFEIVKAADVGEVPGQMREITIGGKKAANDAFHLWQQACSYARAHSAPEKQKGRAAYIYKDITGKWPSNAWSFDGTEGAPISRVVLNKIKSKNIAWSKARAAA